MTITKLINLPSRARYSAESFNFWDPSSGLKSSSNSDPAASFFTSMPQGSIKFCEGNAMIPINNFNDR